MEENKVLILKNSVVISEPMIVTAYQKVDIMLSGPYLARLLVMQGTRRYKIEQIQILLILLPEMRLLLLQRLLQIFGLLIPILSDQCLQL